MNIGNILKTIIAVMLLASCAVRKSNPSVTQEEVTRLIKTLSSDEMEGRGTFTPGIERAAKFIEDEFRNIGLQTLNGENDFRQEFGVSRVSSPVAHVMINDKSIDSSNIIVISDKPVLSFNENSGAEIVKIEEGEQFVQKYRGVLSVNSPVLVLVDPSHASIFKRLQENTNRGRVVETVGEQAGAVFVLGETDAKTFQVNATSGIEKKALFNIVGMLPGKSKEKELVIFSAHYDHLGVVESVDGDSIANGADDNASGTTAVIALARYYKKLNNNERTLIFVAFTAEEMGGFGSKHFSTMLDPDHVAAMFNIEMIGKESKFGKNAAFITGFERSDFGEILQRNLEGTNFKFHPDPYPEQNLFYRSDNATLAALGVPAHTISTDQIDSDKFYHTVKDEFETLDPANILATIKAIALSARSIISGEDTPRRIPKPNDQ